MLRVWVKNQRKRRVRYPRMFVSAFEASLWPIENYLGHRLILRSSLESNLSRLHGLVNKSTRAQTAWPNT